MALDEPSTTSTREAKTALRLRMQALRASMTGEDRAIAALLVAERAWTTVSAVTNARSVAAYAAMPGELDPAPLVSRLRAAGAQIAYPRTERGGVMAFHWVSEESDLAPGRFGVREPPKSLELAESFDLVLVPGLAFDSAGARLGYGAGYYDRFLARTPDATSVGLAFDCQRVASPLPTNARDWPVDWVVTPAGATCYRQTRTR